MGLTKMVGIRKWPIEMHPHEVSCILASPSVVSFVLAIGKQWANTALQVARKPVAGV